MAEFQFSRFPIGWSNEEISKELRQRLDDAQAFLLSEPIKVPSMGKKTDSWKPLRRGKRG